MNNMFEIEYLEDSFSTAVSAEAETIRKNHDLSHKEFMSNSVYAKSIYSKWIESLFDFYKSEWISQTKYLSDTNKIFNNYYYQMIISLGPVVLPFIFEDLQKNGHHWFYALIKITGVNPVESNHLGNINEMKNDWLNWANKYVRA